MRELICRSFLKISQDHLTINRNGSKITLQCCKNSQETIHILSYGMETQVELKWIWISRKIPLTRKKVPNIRMIEFKRATFEGRTSISTPTTHTKSPLISHLQKSMAKQRTSATTPTQLKSLTSASAAENAPKSKKSPSVTALKNFPSSEKLTPCFSNTTSSQVYFILS